VTEEEKTANNYHYEPTSIPVASTNGSEAAVKAFDADWDSPLAQERNQPLVFTLRGQEFRIVPAITLLEQERIKREQAEGKTTVGGFFNAILLTDDDRNRFWEICSDRANPLRDDVLTEIVQWAQEQWGQAPAGK